MSHVDTALRPIVPDRLWHAQAPVRFGPLTVRTRMTVARLGDGTLWVHSPIAPTDALLAQIGSLGVVTHVVAPNASHHLHFSSFLEAFPTASGHVPLGLIRKRPELSRFAVLVPDRWRPDLTGWPVGGLPGLDETAWYHGPTRTLILTDLLFCFGDDNPFLERVVARALGVRGRLAMSRTMRLLVRDRRALSETAKRLLALDVDRVIVAHDRIVDADARVALEAAFRHILR